MSLDPSEHTTAVLSVREEWLLVCWMAKHPRAILEDTVTEPNLRAPGRRAPFAYAAGLAVGTVWVLVRKALE